MLTSAERDEIRQRGWLWDHCWRYFSLLGGEPFLVDECLVHFDGRHLYCNTFPINQESRPDAGTLLASLVERFSPILVWHTGPEPAPSNPLAPALPLRAEQSPSLDDICMEIDLAQFQLRTKKDRAGWIRSCERMGMRWSFSDEFAMTADHLRLIEVTAERINAAGVARALLARLMDFARQREAFIINVHQGDRLIGFSAVEGWFTEMDISLWAFGERSTPGINDYLQWAVLCVAQERGKKRVNVGYSINPGIRAFKIKWGAIDVTKGYYDQLWHSYESFDSRACHWPTRFLFGKESLKTLSAQ